MIAANGWPDLYFATDARGWRVSLVERFAERRGADDDVGKVARLNIGQRVDLPAALRHDADARVLSFGTAVCACKAQGAVVLKNQSAELQFNPFRQRRNSAQSG